MHKLTIDVWSDIACPWCWVGKRRLAAALAAFPHRDAVDVVLRSFELDPAAPRVADDTPFLDRLARKYGTSPAQAGGMIQRVVDVAAGDDLHLDFKKIRPGNTFDAHRLLHLAKDRNLQSQLAERLFRAYLSEGQQLGEHSVLTELAASVGLDRGEVESILASDAYTRDVRADEEDAHQLGIHGVPHFMFGPRHTVSGAQPTAALLDALTRAWTELSSDTMLDMPIHT